MWCGQDLAEVVEMEATRSWASSPIGRVQIPEVLRSCAYLQGGVLCGAVMPFSEYPSTLPACPNPERLKGHAFVW